MEKRATYTNNVDPPVKPSADLEEAPDDRYYCPICKVPCSGLEPYAEHMQSRQHQRRCQLISHIDQEDDASCSSPAKRLKPDSTTQELGCDVCNVKVPGPESLNAHLAGKKHAKKVRELNADKLALAEPVPAIDKKRKIEQSKSELFCEVCQVDILGPEAKLSHETGKKHLRNWKLQKLDVDLNPPSAKKANIQLPLPQGSCEVCKVSEIGLENIEKHKKSAEHSNNLSLLQLNIREIVSEADVTPVLVEAYTEALQLESDTEEED